MSPSPETSLPSSPDTPSASEAKVGLPPGAVVFTGDAPNEPARFEIWTYGTDTLRIEQDATLDDVLAARESPPVSWINVTGIHDTEAIRAIGDHYGLHPLVQEDIAHTGQRSKVDVYDDHLYLVLSMLTLEEDDEDGEPCVAQEQLSIVIRENVVLSFQETAGDIFGPIRNRIRSGRMRIRSAGPDYLAYTLLDITVDHYFVLLEELGEQTETLEDQALEDPDARTLQNINALRRELVSVRRITWPVREMLAQIERSGTTLFSPDTRPFLRDVYDHLIQVLDLVESLRDVVGGLTDLYLTTVSNRMNEVMKVLTIIGTIFLPLTFIVGVYGMNFEYMPELAMQWGYPTVWFVMFAIAVGLLGFFRMKDWL